MAIEFNFDTANNIELPTLVLTRKSGDVINNIEVVHDFAFADSMENPTEFSFSVYKSTCNVWYELKDFRHIYVPEWRDWFMINVELNDSNTTIKNITATHLAEAELSQTKITAEINTDDDEPVIINNEAVLATIYNDNEEISVLHRVLKSMDGNYRVGYVSPSIRGLVRYFSFNDVTVHAALAEIAEELDCYLECLSYTNDEGVLDRVINLYDLDPYCNKCYKRLSSTDTVCTECGSTEINDGYGEDSSVSLSLDNILDSVNYSTDIESVKNCFKLEAGDEYMTSIVMTCNPSGSQYIWNLEPFFDEMSEELLVKYNEYTDLYNKYYNDETYFLDPERYNNLINKYKSKNEDLTTAPSSVIGYSNLMTLMWNVMDMETFLSTTLMPEVPGLDESIKNAEDAALALVDSFSTVAVSTTNIGVATASNAVLDMAKAVIDSRYTVSITEKGFNSSTNIWTGTFLVEKSSDEDDTFSINHTVEVNNDYETFITEKLNKILEKGENKNYGISEIFDKIEITSSYDSKTKTTTYVADTDELFEELHLYGLSMLENFLSCANDAVAVLLEQGAGEEDDDLYSIYFEYYSVQQAIETEISNREAEIEIITNFESQIEDIVSEVQEKLDFQSFFISDDGDKLWKELMLLRREDTYSNSNYIYDGLTNEQLFENANAFIEAAKKELKKSSTLQHTIATSLKNICTIEEFQPFIKHFKIGNWLRLIITDEEVYKLRLIGYDFDFSDYQSMSITFSDVTELKDDTTEVNKTLAAAQAISTSYSYTEKQAALGSKASVIMDSWFDNGLDATKTRILSNATGQAITIDSNGLLGKKQIEFSNNEFEPEQLRIINNCILFTETNWQTISTAVGKFYYYDPDDLDENGDQILKSAYGINGRVICGDLFIGKSLKLYNTSGTLKFDENGFVVTDKDGNERMSITSDGDISLKAEKLVLDSTDAIEINEGNLIIDGGNVTMTGVINALSGGTIGGWVIGSDSLYSTVSSNRSGMCSNSSKYAFWAGETNGAIGSSTTDAKFKVGHNGNLVATSANISGTITATGGSIGGWSISSTRIKSSSTIYMGNAEAGLMLINETNQPFIYAQNSSGTTTFQVKRDGTLYATGATLSGTITATNGTIGAINIVSTREASLHCYDNSLCTSTTITMPILTMTGSSDGVEFWDHVSTSSSIQGGLKAVYGAKQLVFYIKAKPTATSTWVGASDGNVFYVRADGYALTRGLTVSTPLDLKTDTSADGNLRYVSSNNYFLKTTYNEEENSMWMYLNYVKFVDAGVFSNITPADDGSYKLGTSDHRWTQIWCKNSLNSTSDRNMKKDIKVLSEVHKQFFMKLIPVSYMFTDPDSDRTHIGFVAQDVEQAMTECGLTSLDFAGLCKDIKRERVSDNKYDKRMRDVLDENGNPVYIYSLRYTEFIGIITYVLQDSVNRLDKLESLVNQLLAG